jgi:hypothetical protein
VPTLTPDKHTVNHTQIDDPRPTAWRMYVGFEFWSVG